MQLWDFEKYREQIAIITEEGEEYCYRDIFAMQRRIAGRMEKGSLVCIIMQNDVGSLMGHFACMMNDSVPLLLSAQTERNDIYKMWENYMPEYLWFSDKYEDLAEKEKYRKIFTFLGYCLWERKEKCGQKLHSELALLLPTSGSTGNPKLVRISRENVMENTKSICEYLKLKQEERAVTVLPVSYTYGLSIIHTFFYVGASVYVTKQSICQKSFWEGIKKNNVSFFSGVPYTYECMKKMGTGEKVLQSITKLTQAGGKLSEQLQEYWGRFAQKTEKEFFVMYGQTEATARMGYLPPQHCLEKLGSVGIPIPGCELRVVDEEGNEICESHKSGEIICRGKNVSMGYAKERMDLSKGDKNKGVLYTGDLGYKDKEGFIYLCGRKSRFAKIYGKRIDMAYLERELERELGKSVVLLSDDKKIILYTEPEQSRRALEYVQSKTGIYAGVLEYKDICNLPRNEYGKIRYH